MTQPAISPQRVLLPISIGTGLSLLGDSSLYTVLPTHLAEAGVALASVGILLSANRWVRLPLNGPAGLLFERIPRRRLFVPALFLGALSTGLYALTQGFWPLLIGRLLWGIAWVGIWVGGNTIVLDISNSENRGKWVGAYQVAFFLGAAGGAFLGGLMTDWLGYHTTMGVNALLTLLGAVIVLLFLPETRTLRQPAPVTTNPRETDPAAPQPLRRGELASAIALLAVNRLTQAGFMAATLGLYLQQQLGDTVHFGQQTIGVTSVTGLAMGLTTLIATASTPVAGRLSDRAANRWHVAARGLLPGVLGYAVLSTGAPIAIVGGLMLVSVTSGSNMNLSTALIGDLSRQGQYGRRLGALFTLGDLASALGPPLAFALIPWVGLQGVYWLAAGLFAVMWGVAKGWAGNKNASRRREA